MNLVRDLLSMNFLFFPTLTPQLACPYYMPGTAEYQAAEAVHREQAASAENPAGLSNAVFFIYTADLLMLTGVLEGSVAEDRVEPPPVVVALLGM